MDNKKFEQLIDLIINENEEQARALFHDIVVEKSREIYESIMDEEMDEGMGGQVGQFMDEISAEEEGMTEEDESEIEFDDEAEEDGEDLTHDLEADDDMGEEDLEDRVVDLEDKLDELMAEFETIMNGDEEADDMGMEMGDEEGAMDDMAADEEAAMMEAITLKKISVTHGDNGVQTKSTNLNNSGQAGMDSKPVNFSGGTESNPTGPKGPSNPYSNFPIYNVSNSKLSVNGALDLNAKSFNVVNWNGSTASNSQKNIFDSIKIFILGTELESERITLLKDDSDIIISNFQGAEGASGEYFFIKDETITRYFNINIINGSSTYELPIKNQDFKLTVYKRNSVITYSILYPSDSPFFNISNNTEQLILLTRNNVQNIDTY
jgi:hypothetical protein